MTWDFASLMSLAARGQAKKLRELFTAEKMDPHQIDKLCADGLLEEAAKNNRPAVCKMLLDSAHTPDTERALKMAVRVGSVGCVRLLLAAKSDPNADESGDYTGSAWFLAHFRPRDTKADDEIIEMMLKAGADPCSELPSHGEGWNAASVAARCLRPKALARLAPLCHTDTEDENCQTPLAKVMLSFARYQEHSGKDRTGTRFDYDITIENAKACASILLAAGADASKALASLETHLKSKPLQKPEALKAVGELATFVRQWKSSVEAKDLSTVTKAGTAKKPRKTGKPKWAGRTI